MQSILIISDSELDNYSLMKVRLESKKVDKFVNYIDT